MNIRLSFLTASPLLIASICYAQSETKEEDHQPKWDYQIYLTKPAKEVKEVQYDKDCSPVKSRLSDDKKTIIITDYEKGKRIYVKVTYNDGTTEEFTRSSCYIDPLIL